MNVKANITAALVFSATVFLVNSSQVSAQISISTCAELEAIGTDATTLAGSYVLTQNLDCGSSGENFKQTSPGFTPIGGNVPPGTPLATTDSKPRF